MPDPDTMERRRKAILATVQLWTWAHINPKEPFSDAYDAADAIYEKAIELSDLPAALERAEANANAWEWRYGKQRVVRAEAEQERDSAMRSAAGVAARLGHVEAERNKLREVLEDIAHGFAWDLQKAAREALSTTEGDDDG